MAARPSEVALPAMRLQHHVVAIQQGGGDTGFVLEHVQAGAGDGS